MDADLPLKGDKVDLTAPLQAAGAEQPQTPKPSAEDQEPQRSQGALLNANRGAEAK